MFDVGLGLPWNLLAQQLGQAQPAQDLQQLNGLLASVSGAAPSASNQREFESGGDSDELPGRGGGRAKSNRSQNQGANADYAVRHQAAEQRRRARINERLDALRKLVPHDARSNTASFLEEVIRYVLTLKDSVEKLEHALVEAQQQTQHTAPVIVGSKRRADEPPQPEPAQQLAMLQAQLQLQQQQQNAANSNMAEAAARSYGIHMGTQLSVPQSLSMSAGMLPAMADVSASLMAQTQATDMNQVNAASQALLQLQQQQQQQQQQQHTNTPNLMPPPSHTPSNFNSPGGGRSTSTPPAATGSAMPGAANFEAATLQQALGLSGAGTTAGLAISAQPNQQQVNMLQLLLQLQQQQQMQQQLAGAQSGLLLQQMAGAPGVTTDPAMVQRLMAVSMQGNGGMVGGPGTLLSVGPPGSIAGLTPSAPASNSQQ